MAIVVPIPARPPLFAEPAGRPGDWWEPVPERAVSVAAVLGTEARRRRLPVDLLAALLVEHALIGCDVAECAVDPRQATAALAGASEIAAASGPGRMNTSYIRMLRTGELGFEPESDAQLARRDLILPLRLHDAAARLPLRDLSSQALDDAVRWETAAATHGQFMREWALRVLLAAAVK